MMHLLMIYLIAMLQISPSVSFRSVNGKISNSPGGSGCNVYRSSRALQLRSLRLATASSDDLSLEAFTSVKSLEDVNKLVEGSKIFKIHSVAAGVFGTLLLLFPDLLLGSGPVAAFAYQQWSLFILAVSYITNKAIDLEDVKAKEMLATAFFVMCSGETLLYLKEILSTLGRIPIVVYLIDISSLFVFAALAYGYYSSGLTSFSTSED